MIIREPRPGDREQQEKMNMTWNPADSIQIRVEKKPLDSAELFFPNHLELIARDAEENTMLASIGAGQLKLRCSGENVLGGFLYDLKIKNYRPQVFSRLWSALSIHAEEQELAFFFCYQPRNEQHHLKWDQQPQPEIIGEQIIYFLPVHRPLAHRGQAGHFTPKKEETPKEHTVNISGGGEMELFPLEIPPAFLDRYQGEVQGPSRAAKVWESGPEFQFSLHYPTAWYHLLPHLLKKELPFSRRPAPGQKVRGWLIYELEQVEASEIPGLLEGIRRKACQQGISFIAPCFNSVQDIPPSLASRAWGRVIYDICFFPLTRIKTPDKTPYFHPAFL